MEDGAFGTSIVMFSVFIIGLGFAAIAIGWSSFVCYLMCSLGIAMFLNALVPHLLLSFVLRSYMPGLATGLLLNIPLAVIYVSGALRLRLVNWHTLLWAGPLGAVLILGIATACIVAGRGLARATGSKLRSLVRR